MPVSRLTTVPDDIEPLVFADRQLEEDRELERQAAFWEVRGPVVDYRRELAQSRRGRP
ncbi:hypothetical protein Rleg10DRAFT_3510 [Rhizobium leguminosarum bv. trifolii WSM2012]|nr:hypothetical protein Rleg10DRAFT_3510 [Rhizobium leguminosarum bv. trifolii WSM2012]